MSPENGSKSDTEADFDPENDSIISFEQFEHFETDIELDQQGRLLGSSQNELFDYDLLLICFLVIILIIIFMGSIMINVSILMVFARKQTLRTTTNRFLINMLVVNILSSSLYLPLVLLSIFIGSEEEEDDIHGESLIQSLLFQSVSHFIGCLSVLSTLCTGLDQYIGVCHPLHYHRHMTRIRSNYSIASAWMVSLLISVSLTVISNLEFETIIDIIFLTCVNLTHTLPFFLLSLIYTKIFRAAQGSSERARRNSAVSVAPSDSVTPLNLSSNDMRRLNRLAKATQAPSQGPALNKPPSVPSDLSRQVSSTKSEPTLHRQGSLMSHLGSSMRRKMSSASHVIAREEAKTAKVYTVSLLLLLVTWTPFYISHMIQIITTDDNFTIHLSPIITIAATIYAPLSAILHGYRNTKVRRELCQMFSLQCEDVATPLPSRRGKVFRSLSMRESTRIRNRDVRRDRLLRHSFMGDINNHKQNNEKENTIIKNKLPSDCIESQTLLLSLTSSSAESSARSSFSTGPSHPRYVTLLANHRQEVTC